MIRTIIHISLLRLWHNKAELLLTFIVPILFFSIFAWIFGSRSGNGGSTPRLKVVACDEIDSPVTQRTIALLQNTSSLRFHLGSNSSSEAIKPVSREAAEALVRRGMVTAAIVFSARDKDAPGVNPLIKPILNPLTQTQIGSMKTEPMALATGDDSPTVALLAPETNDDRSGNDSLESKSPAIEVFADSFDQVASQVIVAFVQKASMTAQAEHAAQQAQEQAAKIQTARQATA